MLGEPGLLGLVGRQCFLFQLLLKLSLRSLTLWLNALARRRTRGSCRTVTPTREHTRRSIDRLCADGRTTGATPTREPMECTREMKRSAARILVPAGSLYTVATTRSLDQRGDRCCDNKTSRCNDGCDPRHTRRLCACFCLSMGSDRHMLFPSPAV